MEEDLTELSYKKLKKRVKKTRDLLDSLETELKKRKLDRQHDDVEHMEEYLDVADSSILNLTSQIKKLMAGKK